MKKILFAKNIFLIILNSNRELMDNKMAGLIPLFLGLLIFSILMVFINAVSPLAPFVYSLF